LEFKNKKPALLLVDIQKAFLDKEYPGTDENYVGIKRNNPKAEEVCGSILKKWRELGFLVIHVRHSSTSVKSKLHESSPGYEFNDFVKPKNNEIILTKKVNSSFIGTGLVDILDTNNVKSIVIVGMTTNHCISTTVRMSGNLGYDTYLVSDSTAAYCNILKNGEVIDCEDVYKISLSNLDGEFCKVLTRDELFNNLI